MLFAPLEVFKLGPEGGVDLVWSAKGISDAETLRTVLQKYDNLVLDQTWVVVDSESSTLLDDRQILEISRLMVREIKARLGHGYKLVETPDENTLCLSLALTTHETLQPFLGMASCLLPAASNMPTVSRIVSNQQTDAGGVTVELLVSDARTREPLIAAVDKHFSDKGIVSMITAPGGANDAISLWADRLMTTLRDWNWIKTR